MQAYGEGFDILHASDYDLTSPPSPACGSRVR